MLFQAKSFQEIQKALERSGTLTLESARKLIHGHQDHHTRISRINVGPPSSVLEVSTLRVTLKLRRISQYLIAQIVVILKPILYC